MAVLHELFEGLERNAKKKLQKKNLPGGGHGLPLLYAEQRLRGACLSIQVVDRACACRDEWGEWALGFIFPSFLPTHDPHPHPQQSWTLGTAGHLPAGSWQAIVLATDITVQGLGSYMVALRSDGGTSSIATATDGDQVILLGAKKGGNPIARGRSSRLPRLHFISTIHPTFLCSYLS